MVHRTLLPILAMAVALAVAGCVGGSRGPGASARIVDPSSPLQCVAYARTKSGISLRGDAWTWWRAADGRYAKGRVPQIGSVLVLKRTGSSLGHVAVVRHIETSRVIVVDHANWLNQGRIHENTPVVDVSPANDWSMVRLWYTPGDHWGGRTYPAYGFIYPDRVAALPAS